MVAPRSAAIRGRSLAATLTLVLASSIAGAAPAAAAPLCALDTAAKRLTVTSQGNSGVTIKAGSGYLLVNDVSCATLTQVDTVSVDMAATISQLRLDLSGGPLGPGATDEGNGSSEIEFELRGFGNNTSMAVTKASQVSAGTFLSVQSELLGHINLNVAADGATRDVDVVIYGALPWMLNLSGDIYGPAVLSGAGAGGFGARPYSGRMSLEAGSYANQLTGGSGDDVLLSGPSANSPLGADTFAGGGGFDWLVIQATAATAGDLAQYSLDDVANDGLLCPGINCESDNVRSDIEHLEGSEMAERFIGSPLSTVINGGLGDDDIEGGGGRDTLRGGPGRDQLAGGGGQDVLLGDPVGDGGDDLWGGRGDDTVSYADLAGPVDVSLNGRADDGATGELDNIANDIERVVGTDVADFFTGNAQANIFSGKGGDDQFTGRSGDDTLLGGIDNDSFSGGPGVDRCAQGPGSGPKLDCET